MREDRFHYEQAGTGKNIHFNKQDKAVIKVIVNRTGLVCTNALNGKGVGFIMYNV